MKNASVQPAAKVVRAEHRESGFTRMIEQQTAKIPSHVFLFLGLASMLASAIFEFTDRAHLAHFIGMWPPALFIMGIYNKIVKTSGMV